MLRNKRTRNDLARGLASVSTFLGKLKSIKRLESAPE
jgi:hypothetical protein